MSSFAEEMAQYDDAWTETKPAENTGPVVFTDGTHEAIITTARVEEGQYGWQLVLAWRGLDSNTKRPASIRRWDNIPPTDERAEFLAADLIALGFSTTAVNQETGADYEVQRPLSELEQACQEELFIGKVCTIYVKTKRGAERDYTNCYINRVNAEKRDPDQYLAGLSGDFGSDQFVPAAGGDDDIPF